MAAARERHPSHGVEVAVRTVADLVVTVLRFVAMRARVFTRGTRRPDVPGPRPAAARSGVS